MKRIYLVLAVVIGLSACSQPSQPAASQANAASADDGAAARAKSANEIANAKYTELKPVGGASDTKADSKPKPETN